MPGFLGTERQFAARYGKPILASRDAKSSSREQEAGMWALLVFNKTLVVWIVLLINIFPNITVLLRGLLRLAY